MEYSFSDDLKPGIWQVQMQTAPAQGEFSGCFVQIRTQSRIQIYHGYTQDPYNDFPGIEPIKGSSKFLSIGYLHKQLFFISI